MTAPFLFVPIFRAFDTAGNPLAGGSLYTYAAGTTTPLATYSDAAGTIQNANPVVLDSTGSATIRLGTAAYKFVLKDSGGATQWTEDNYEPAALQNLLADAVSGHGADLIANSVRSYDLFSNVRAANTPVMANGQTLIIDVQGATATNDGGGGFFYWNANSAGVDDGINVIKPTAVSGVGRYLRQILSSTGTFTATYSGFSANPTTTITWKRSGNVVTLIFPLSNGTSNGTSFGLTGMPSTLNPASGQIVPCVGLVDNAVIKVSSVAAISSGGGITFYPDATGGSWTNPGTKGFGSTSQNVCMSFTI